MTLDLFLKAVQLLALGLLILFAAAVWVGTWLEERRRGYRLPYEQPSHVRLCPFDQDAAS